VHRAVSPCTRPEANVSPRAETRDPTLLEDDVTVSATFAGQIVPDLTLPLLDGGDLPLRSLRGKKVLLFFWGSW
jgi:hypothetical protein